MISFRLKKISISIAFSFFAVLTLLLLLDKTKYTMLGLIACILHEMGHIFVMCLCEISPNKIILYGAGIKIIPNYDRITSMRQDFFILIAGSLTNFIIFAVLYPISQNNFTLALFSVINLVIGIFNLIPFKHFDGGRIIDLVISNYAKKNSIAMKKAVRVIAILSLIMLGMGFALTQKGNISLYLSIGYIIFSELML